MFSEKWGRVWMDRGFVEPDTSMGVRGSLFKKKNANKNLLQNLPYYKTHEPMTWALSQALKELYNCGLEVSSFIL